MATLLNIDVTEMNGVAKDHQKLYSIASRCGVFAKSDIQPLLLACSLTLNHYPFQGLRH